MSLLLTELGTVEIEASQDRPSHHRGVAREEAPVSPTPTADPVALLDGLQPDAIRAQLREAEARQRALRVLLRAACAWDRAARRQQQADSHQGGPTDAD